MKLLLICLMAVLCISLAAGASRKKTRIVGGHVITIDKAPYIVTLKDEDGHFCGGTLVSKRFVVTAAHCLNSVHPDDITVVGDASTLSGKGTERKVVKAFIPAKYDRDTVHMDVAVLKLDGDMTGKFVKPIPLCSTPLKENDLVQVSGWGLTHEDNTEASEQLRTIRVPVLSTKECARKYKKNDEELTDTMFCASQTGVKDSCTMDSGGPLIFNGQLCGIVSWGAGCADADYPGVYTDVNKVLNFINKAMKG